MPHRTRRGGRTWNALRNHDASGSKNCDRVIRSSPSKLLADVAHPARGKGCVAPGEAKRCSRQIMVSFIPCCNAPWPASNIYLGRSEEHTSELQSLMRISYA